MILVTGRTDYPSPDFAAQVTEHWRKALKAEKLAAGSPIYPAQRRRWGLLDGFCGLPAELGPDDARMDALYQVARVTTGGRYVPGARQKALWDSIGRDATQRIAANQIREAQDEISPTPESILQHLVAAAIVDLDGHYRREVSKVGKRAEFSVESDQRRVEAAERETEFVRAELRQTREEHSRAIGAVADYKRRWHEALHDNGADDVVDGAYAQPPAYVEPVEDAGLPKGFSQDKDGIRTSYKDADGGRKYLRGKTLEEAVQKRNAAVLAVEEVERSRSRMGHTSEHVRA